VLVLVVLPGSVNMADILGLTAIVVTLVIIAVAIFFPDGGDMD